MSPQLWLSALIAGISAVKIGLGLAGGIYALLTDTPGVPGTALVYIALMLAYSTGAGFLLRGRHRDRRALLLGVFFLLVATSFAHVPRGVFSGVPVLATLVSLWNALLPEAFLPFFAWSFFSEFPRVRTAEPDRISWWGRTVSLALGVVLLLSNLLLRAPGLEALEPVLTYFDRTDAVGAYWLLLLGASLPAFGYGLRRARQATVDERRRTNLLLFGFVLGSMPVLLLVLLFIAIPPFFEVLSRPPWFFLSQILVYTGLLSIPATTGYAVLARGAFGVGLILRAAIRYALARRTVTFLTLLPLAGFAAVLVVNREESLTLLVTGPSGVALLVVVSVGLLGLRFRNAALQSLDESFFRERYDARKILRALVHGVREVENVNQLRQLISREVDRALHPRFVSLLTLNPLSRVFETQGKEVPPLPETSMIAGALRGSRTTLDVPTLVGQEGDRLSVMERHWLQDSDAATMVPLLSSGKDLLGLILLGERRSELPYSHEDKGLLVDIAAAASGTLEQRLIPRLSEEIHGRVPQREPAPGPVNPMDQMAARECVTCGQLGPSYLKACPVCGGAVENALVPLDIRGVYRVERRIGEGGMGLVYRALDVNLRRHVALKTLLRVDPDLAARLRHEARAMASVSHPNLATIYGAETWKGRPLILVEYFAAGTLEDRLEKQPMTYADAIRMGMALTRGIGYLHDLGMLHRDIKPSNIGLSEVRDPVLLDFGLAHFLPRDSGSAPASGVVKKEEALTALPGEGMDQPSLRRTQTGRFRGTLSYLSPETLVGERQSPRSDLWSLCVVLYEAITGENPFLRPGGAARTSAPDLRISQPDCPPEVAEFFLRALSTDPSRRPSNAKELLQELEGIHGAVA